MFFKQSNSINSFLKYKEFTGNFLNYIDGFSVTYRKCAFLLNIPERKSRVVFKAYQFDTCPQSTDLCTDIGSLCCPNECKYHHSDKAQRRMG